MDYRLFEGGSGASDPGFASQTITAASNTNPITVTTGAAHGFLTGQQVVVTNGTGNTGVNGTYFVQVVNSTQFNLIGSIGIGTYNSNSAKVARSGIGWLGIAGQYNGGGYSTVAGINTGGHMFLGSAAPTVFNTAALQITGAYYQTGSNVGVPYNQLGQGPSGTGPYVYTDSFLNVASTPASGTEPEFVMSVNCSPGSTAVGCLGGYFAVQTTGANQNIWGLNPVVITNLSPFTAMRSLEADVNQNNAGNPADTNQIGFADGVDSLWRHWQLFKLFASYKGGGTNAWKTGLWLQNVGYTGYSGVDPSAVYGDSSNRFVYGLTLRSATFQANPTNKISSGLVVSNNVAAVAALNAGATQDVQLLKLDNNNFVDFGDGNAAALRFTSSQASNGVGTSGILFTATATNAVNGASDTCVGINFTVTGSAAQNPTQMHGILFNMTNAFTAAKRTSS
jgi:hypothetical protein